MNKKNQNKTIEALDKLSSHSWVASKFCFRILLVLVDVFLTVIKLFGAGAAIFILYRMYPETYILLATPFSQVFSILGIFFTVILSSLAFTFNAYIILKIIKVAFNDRFIRISKRRSSE